MNRYNTSPPTSLMLRGVCQPSHKFSPKAPTCQTGGDQPRAEGEGKYKRRAFTLVELLVVIAIIGLLSSVAVVSTTSARQSS